MCSQHEGQHRQFDGHDFDEFFQRATGFAPHPFQRRIAEAGLPDLIDVPTGCGKSEAVVVPWLWWWVRNPDEAPLRLLLILPLRALCTDLEARVTGILERLHLQGQVDVHVLMGGGRFDPDAHQRWRTNPHRPSVVIGTIDAAVSTLLHRGYFSTRSAATMDFALLTSATHIVLDEGHLSDQAVSTLRQLAAFQSEQGTFGRTGLTIMSATMQEAALDTVDNPASDATRISLGTDDHESALSARLNASRTLRRLDVAKPKDVAHEAAASHEPGTLTLVIANNVDTARDTFKALSRCTDAPALLVHSRFRAHERAAQQDKIGHLREAGGIIVSTQALEAGVDLDARLLITEASTIASFAQRVGRCNRRGLLSADEAQVLWFEPLAPKSSPYDPGEVAALIDMLRDHEGGEVTSIRLTQWRQQLPAPDVVRRVIRRRDFAQLFDTTPDLAGDDVDIRPYISADEDTDVAIAWVSDDELDSAALAQRHRKPPPRSHMCPVPLSVARKFVDKNTVRAAAFRNELDQWRILTAGRHVRPQDVILVTAGSGGYSPETGFDLSLRTPVDIIDDHVDPAQPDGDGTESEPGAVSAAGEWISLAQHSEETLQQADSLLAVTDLIDDPVVANVVRVAAHYHDIGKAFAEWQSILASPDRALPDGGPWAKSPETATGERLRRSSGQRRGLRHEVISALALLSTPGAQALHTDGIPPERVFLTAYLVAAHHGKLRASVWDPRRDGHTGDALYGLREGDRLPDISVGQLSLPAADIDVALLTQVGGDSWASRVDRLLDEFGPFRLAMLETLVRVADWRASGGQPLCEEN